MTKFQISLIKTIIMLVYTAIKMVKQLMVEKLYFRDLMSCYETGRDFEDDPLIDFT